MYPSSSSASSSSSTQQQQSSINHTGLTRYGSAPGSLLTSTVDAVIGGSRFLAGQGQGQGHGHGHYYSGDSSEPSCKEQRSSSPYEPFPGSALLRQKSSPAGFLSHLANTSTHNAGFTITRGSSRLKSELSFTGQGQGQECLSRISEGVVDPTSDHTTSTPAYAGTAFGIQPSCSWDNSNSIVFSAPQSKRSKTNDPDILHCLTALESQFSLPQTTLEMATVDKLYIPEDSVPCKIRAKRGCATHPRSIAERERRTRISGRLKKLQDLVPNMDKQTSYADMLDLAVQHIKGLQSQVQKLQKELESCTCGCKQST